MNECLITKLKHSITDNSLPKLNELKLNVTVPDTYTETNHTFNMRCEENTYMNLRLDGIGYVTD